MGLSKFSGFLSALVLLLVLWVVAGTDVSDAGGELSPDSDYEGASQTFGNKSDLIQVDFESAESSELYPNDPIMNESAGLAFESSGETRERLFAQLTSSMSDEDLASYRKLEGFPVVRTYSGELRNSYAESVRCEQGGLSNKCETIIKDMETQNVVFEGGVWSPNFEETGFEREVVRIK